MNDIVLTFDVDWAPDPVIDDVACRLIEAGVRSTWYITHDSPAVDRLRQRPDLFELGIHPNFLPGSTHGSTPSEVLSHCVALVPDAKSVRTHSLMQSSHTFVTLSRETDIRIDTSLYVRRMAGITPVEYRVYGASFCRIPYFWEDDEEMEYERASWSPSKHFTRPGLKVLDFHPIHVYLNSPHLDTYRRARHGVADLQAASRADLAPFVHEGEGTRTMFDHVITHLQRVRSRTIYDVYAEWTGRDNTGVSS